MHADSALFRSHQDLASSAPTPCPPWASMVVRFIVPQHQTQVCLDTGRASQVVPIWRSLETCTTTQQGQRHSSNQTGLQRGPGVVQSHENATSSASTAVGIGSSFLWSHIRIVERCLVACVQTAASCCQACRAAIVPILQGPPCSLAWGICRLF